MSRNGKIIVRIFITVVVLLISAAGFFAYAFYKGSSGITG